MLVLARKENEGIIITTKAGERIEVVLLDAAPRRVRIGIGAPDSVTINRKEVQNMIDRKRFEDDETNDLGDL